MFRKSSLCESSACPEVAFVGASKCEAGTCPEVALGPDEVQFRDSREPEVIVRIKPESWAVFTDAVKAGEFDLV